MKVTVRVENDDGLIIEDVWEDGNIRVRYERASVHIREGEMDQRGLGPGDELITIARGYPKALAGPTVVTDEEIIARARAANGRPE